MNHVLSPASDLRPKESFDETVARMVPVERLRPQIPALHEKYLAAKPFPHIAIDGLFDEDVLDRLAAEFPDRGSRDWLNYDTANEIKQTSRGVMDLSAFAQAFMWRVCAQPMMQAIRDITGIENLCVDPLFHGGGFHESFRGGWLNMHVDWTQHPVLPLGRRLNMIIYLNRDWDPSWGGALELKNKTTGEGGAKVAPIFNRTVIFPTTDETLHGFPDPMTCPPDRSRKSVSFFFWAPDEDSIKAGAPITFLPGNGVTKTRAFLRSLVPPAAFAARDKLKGMLRGG